MKVVLFGYYGYGNLGDDIMMASAARAIADVPCAEVSVVMDSQAVPTACDRANIRYVSLAGKRGKALTLARILKADRVIWGGGTCLYEPPGGELSGLRFLARAARLCRILRRPVHFAGIGIGDIESQEARRLVTGILADAATLSFRDEASALKARNLGAEPKKTSLGGDLFFIGQHQLYRGKSLSSELRTISFSGLYEYASQSGLVESYGKMLNSWVRELGVDIHFIPMQQGRINDNDFHEAIARYLPAGSFSTLSYSRSEDCVRLMEQADFHVGMRLHSLALADCIGLPNIGIAYAPKVARYVEKSGMGAYSRLAEIGEDISPARLLEARRSYTRNTAFLQAEQLAASACLNRLLLVS